MPRTVNKVPFAPKLERKKRVAAYARVSTGKDAMLHSLSSQVGYYSELIQNHSDWVYAGVYADESMTGTKESRDEFQRLLNDCRAGRIDMILTKSISRFARNTVTLLEAVRELKALQKKFTIDFLQKKMKTNEGEVPQYYVESSHEAIIAPIEWEMVQAEIARRKALGRAYSGSSAFASRLVCGDCVGFYGQKVWHSTDAYRKVIWRCNRKFKGDQQCATPHIDAETIQQKFLIAYDRLMASRESVISNCEQIRSALSDCSAIDAELEALNEEINVVAGLVKGCVKENASTAQSQEEYAKKYNGLLARYEKATAQVKEITAEKERKQSRERDLRLFTESLKIQPLVLEKWDERLWVALIDKATVYRDGRIVFRFKSGKEIEVEP